MEHRAKGSSDTWTGQKTGKHQLAIPFQVGSALEIRVAAENCIGRSEFSPVVDTESAIEEDNLEEEKETCLLPPAELKVASVTHNTAELQWTPSSGDYQVWRTVWREEQIPRWELCEPLGQPSCLVENLEPETKYLATVSTVSEDGSKRSILSDVVEFATSSEMRFHFVFGEPVIKRDGHKLRTILLVGSSGSGKMSFINAINCIFNVQWWNLFPVMGAVNFEIGRKQRHLVTVFLDILPLISRLNEVFGKSKPHCKNVVRQVHKVIWYMLKPLGQNEWL